MIEGCLLKMLTCFIFYLRFGALGLFELFIARHWYKGASQEAEAETLAALQAKTEATASQRLISQSHIF